MLDKRPEYRKAKIMERIVEPERVIMFRVPWIDDNGEVQVNRGFRIEMNSAIGPYKGGLRFHPSVNLGILKFLAFEQVFKNALTTLPMGGGKGGSDFDPKGKSDNEVMRFCQSFMTELLPPHRPGHRRARRRHRRGRPRDRLSCSASTSASATSSPACSRARALKWGGSLIRPEATGYGAVYFAQEMLETRKQDLKGKTCLVSGSGNVAQYTVEKILHLGGKAVTVSDSAGYIYDEQGIDREQAGVRHGPEERQARPHQGVRRQVPEGRLHGHRSRRRLQPAVGPSRPTAPSPAPRRTRSTPRTRRTCCATACYVVSEGANMPTVPAGVEQFIDAKILYGPGKAANAGGVATSGLEMSQNSMRLSWTPRRGRRAAARHHEVHPQELRGAPPRPTARRATTSTAPTSPAS